MCAKWQWNARGCVTILHDRRSRECNPVTPVECVSLSHPCVLAFITHHIMHSRNRDYIWLVNLIYFALHIFQIRNLLHCVWESWWNMPFKETWFGNATDNYLTHCLPSVLMHFCVDSPQSARIYPFIISDTSQYRTKNMVHIPITHSLFQLIAPYILPQTISTFVE